MKWEYLHLKVSASDDFAALLNKHGAEAWELVSVVQSISQSLAGVAVFWISIFKRPLADAAVPIRSPD